ncbi:hypothetical protein [Xenorhabdus sp. SGI246]|uniref:hypothetical protein n=1 Tax=Xenorhabdus sp. SGI246 TaxID=3158263 RepID=UPI00349F796F
MDSAISYYHDKYIANYTEFDFYVSIYTYFNKKKEFASKYIKSNSWELFKIPRIPILTGIVFQSVTTALQLRYFAQSDVSREIMSHFQKPSIHLHQGRDVKFYFYLTSTIQE